MEFLVNQLEIEDCNAHHKSLSQLDSNTTVNLLQMTIDRTRARTVQRTEVMERIGDRINQKHKNLQILHVSLENPQGWRTSA